MPLGNTQTWEEFDDQVHQGISVDLRLASLDELIVLFVHRATHRTDTAFKCLLGQHALFGLQRFEHGLTMHIERTQTSGTRTLR